MSFPVTKDEESIKELHKNSKKIPKGKPLTLPTEPKPKIARSSASDVERFLSGSTELNCCLNGGWGLGKIISIGGLPSTGKTLLAIEACANYVKKYPNGKIWYVDAEAAFDTAYAESVGLPIENVEFVTIVENGEERVLETIEEFGSIMRAKISALKDGETGIFILDSVDAMTTDKEREVEALAAAIAKRLAAGEKLTEKQMALPGTYGTEKAKALSKLFRTIVRLLEQKKVAAIFISQLREQIGAQFKSYGKSGGLALMYYASQSVMLKKAEAVERTVKGTKKTTGVAINLKVDKNKLGKPFGECGFNIIFDYGIDDLAANLEYLKDNDSLGELGDIALAEDPKTKVVGPVKKLDTIVNRLADLIAQPGGEKEYRDTIELISLTTERVWYEIDANFKPTRPKKY